MGNFKSILLSVAIAGTGFLNQGCDDFTMDYQRTASSPSTVVIQNVVPLGHDECTDVQVVSESSDCGPIQQETTCTTTADSCVPSVGFPVCQHTETNCNWVKDFDATIHAEIDFDPNAKLSAGQTEDFGFSATYKDGIITITPSVKSSVYSYTFPPQVQFDYRTTGRVRFQLAPAGSKPNQGL